jgi:thioredoxin 1
MQDTVAEQAAIELTDVDFAEAVGSGVTLVDFWAPWCGPCQMQGPIVEQVAGKVAGRAKVAKVNVDDAVQAASRHGIRSIPTLIVFKDGEVVNQFVGVQSEAQLVAAIESAL